MRYLQGEAPRGAHILPGLRGDAVKWSPGIRQPYQQTEEGTARAHLYYYIYRADNSLWRAGRYMFNHDVDFRIDFSSPQVARDYIEIYDKEMMLIEAM